jgi:hypothetical protein
VFCRDSRSMYVLSVFLKCFQLINGCVCVCVCMCVYDTAFR